MVFGANILNTLRTKDFFCRGRSADGTGAGESDSALCVREDTAFAANRGDDPLHRAGEWFRHGPAQEGDMTLTLLDPVTGKRVTITIDERGRIV